MQSKRFYNTIITIQIQAEGLSDVNEYVNNMVCCIQNYSLKVLQNMQ
jgi:hypothetical protein